MGGEFGYVALACGRRPFGNRAGINGATGCDENIQAAILRMFTRKRLNKKHSDRRVLTAETTLEGLTE